MKTLVITGGIGSGKSVVCSYLALKGIPVYDSDTRAKLLYDTHPEIMNSLESSLGMVLHDAEGHLDRKVLAGAIFSNPANLAIAESVIHPYVFTDFLDWRNGYFGQVPFVVLESAIFLQKPLFRPLADKIILIDAPEELRLERVASRDSATRENVLSRMRAQAVDKSGADAVIVNDSDIQSLIDKVDATLETIWND